MDGNITTAHLVMDRNDVQGLLIDLRVNAQFAAYAAKLPGASTQTAPTTATPTSAAAASAPEPRTP